MVTQSERPVYHHAFYDMVAYISGMLIGSIIVEFYKYISRITKIQRQLCQGQYKHAFFITVSQIFLNALISRLIDFKYKTFFIMGMLTPQTLVYSQLRPLFPIILGQDTPTETDGCKDEDEDEDERK